MVKPFNRKSLVIIVAVLIVIAALLFIHNRTHNTTSVVNTAPARTSVATADPSYKQQIDNGTILVPGQTATYNSISIKVNSVSVSDTATTGDISKSAEPGTKFLTVNITAVNLGDNPFVPFSSTQPLTLITSDYKAINNDMIDTIAYTEDSLLEKSLNPSVPMTGTLIYIVPSTLHSGVIGTISSVTNKFVGSKVSF